MILVIGDGPRDSVALPNIVLRLLGEPTQFQFEDWHNYSHLQGRGRGTIYSKKVKYFTRLAKDLNCFALVVVSDTDKAKKFGEKLRELRQGREEDRRNCPAFPTALGEANPHFDVWLLDDAHAVTLALSCEPDAVPNVRDCPSPKDTLNELIAKSNISGGPSDILGAIAANIVLSRCSHAKETGLAAFAEEIRSELRPAI